VRFEKPETSRTFKEEVDKITHKRNTMDIFEAVTEMKIEERVGEIVRNMLADTEFSDDKIASLAGVSVDFVQEVREDLNKK
jgi:predicted XRE-type DNA-binding protein